MPHLVRYKTADGTDADHEVDDLGEAIAHVERLRNDEGIDAARIFRIEEVAFEFKPYFRVEIGTLPGAVAAPPAPVRMAPELLDAGPPFAASAVQSDASAEAAAAPALAAPWAPAAAAGAAGDHEAAAGHEPAHATSDVTITVDPWADAPPPPAAEDVVTNGSGRRGLFGR